MMVVPRSLNYSTVVAVLFMMVSGAELKSTNKIIA